MGARRYGPETGRFLQRDLYHNALADLSLATDPLTQNRYSYAGCNPVSFIETDGHEFEWTNADAYWCAANLTNKKCAGVSALAVRAYGAMGSLQDARLLSVNRPENTADAFRHCFWIGAVALKYGQSTARDVGFNHEWRRAGPGETTREWRQKLVMDVHNNTVGMRFARDIGGRGGGNATGKNLDRLIARCWRATQGGGRGPKLWVLDRGQNLRLAAGADRYGRLVGASVAARYYANFARYVYENMDEYPNP